MNIFLHSLPSYILKKIENVLVSSGSKHPEDHRKKTVVEQTDQKQPQGDRSPQSTEDFTRVNTGGLPQDVNQR